VVVGRPPLEPVAHGSGRGVADHHHLGSAAGVGPLVQREAAEQGVDRRLGEGLAGDVDALGELEVEDLAVAALTFKSGAVGTLTATTAAYKGFPVRLDIFGTEGTAILEGDRLRSMVLKSGEEYEGEAAASHAVSVAQGGTASVREEAGQRSVTAATGEVWGDAHRAQIEDFIQAVRTGGKPLIDGRGGRKPLEIILAVYRSSRTGKPVTLGAV
jgi:predicted dehydrogenase